MSWESPWRRQYAILGVAVVLVVSACTGQTTDTSTTAAEPPSTTSGGNEPSTTAQTTTPDPEASGGVLRIGQTADVTTLNPLGVLSASESSLHNQLYNTLVQVNQDQQPEPELATAWEFADDGLSLTLTLREDVVFHSGRPFTSADVAFTVDWAKDPANGALIQPLAARVVAVETPDEVTASLQFDSPFPAALDLLDLLFVIDEETAGDGFDTTAVGTGPFMLEERVPGDRITLVRNEQYWNGPPALDGVEIVVLPNEQAQVLQLETGDIHYVQGLAFRDIDLLGGNEDVATGVAVTGAAVMDVIFNVREQPLDDVAVRRALDMAVDRERIAQILYGDAGEGWCLPFPPGSIAYVEELAAGCTYDLEGAQALLAESGYEDGLAVEILTSTPAGEGIAPMAEIIQADFASIGVDATIRDVELAAYQDSVVTNRDFQVATHSFGRAQKDPSSLLEATVVFRPEDNASGFESDEYADLIIQAGSEPDPEERARMYQEVAQIIVDEKFVLPVAPIPVFWAGSANVSGFEWTRDGFLILENATLG